MRHATSALKISSHAEAVLPRKEDETGERERATLGMGNKSYMKGMQKQSQHNTSFTWAEHSTGQLQDVVNGLVDQGKGARKGMRKLAWRLQSFRSPARARHLSAVTHKVHDRSRGSDDIGRRRGGDTTLDGSSGNTKPRRCGEGEANCIARQSQLSGVGGGGKESPPPNK